MAMGEPEVLIEVHRVLERRDGAIFRTEYVEDRWVPMSQRWTPESTDFVHSCKGTAFQGPTIRSTRIP